jgi:hypothetical protein
MIAKGKPTTKEKFKFKLEINSYIQTTYELWESLQHTMKLKLSTGHGGHVWFLEPMFFFFWTDGESLSFPEFLLEEESWPRL